MSFLSRLRTSVAGQTPPGDASGTAGDAPGLSEAEVTRAQELRVLLHENPNDADAFGELANYVRRNASAVALADPLTADSNEESDPARLENLAVWALAEELAGRPKAWYPLLELARLSLGGDPEAAVRRLTSAVERDHSGVALTEAVAILRDAGRPVEGYNLGIAHWNPAEQGVDTGRQLILAALEAERPADAKRTLRDLEEARGPEVAQIAEELRGLIDAAEQARSAEKPSPAEKPPSTENPPEN